MVPHMAKGRPKKKTPKYEEHVGFSHVPGTNARYANVAEALGKTRSEWLREVCDAAAEAAEQLADEDE